MFVGVWEIVGSVLTVQLRWNTVCTCCAAGLRLAGGKRTSWGGRPQGLGPTGSTRTVCRSDPCSRHSWKEQRGGKTKHLMVFSLSVFLLPRWKDQVTQANKDLFCAYFHSTAAENRYPPHPAAITVISPICLGQWQVSWSCSLYSFSHKSLLIVSLEGCCASPALGPWQSADLEGLGGTGGLSSQSSGMPGPGGLS